MAFDNFLSNFVFINHGHSPHMNNVISLRYCYNPSACVLFKVFYTFSFHPPICFYAAIVVPNSLSNQFVFIANNLTSIPYPLFSNKIFLNKEVSFFILVCSDLLSLACYQVYLHIFAVSPIARLLCLTS